MHYNLLLQDFLQIRDTFKFEPLQLQKVDYQHTHLLVPGFCTAKCKAGSHLFGLVL